MWEIFDVGVAVFTAENSVGAGGMPGRIDRNALPGSRLHPGFAMARETLLVFIRIFVRGERGRHEG